MKVAVFGAYGTIGRAVTATLLGRGDSVRVVGRSAAKLQEAFGAAGVEMTIADVATAEGCEIASQGMDAIVYSLGVPYTKRDFAHYPAMMRLAIAAAVEAKVRRLLLVSNVYSYSPLQTPTVHEDHPREPTTVKGRYRKEQEDVALGAHGTGHLETLVLRSPDFYGPFADLSMGNLIIAAAVQGKPANLLGPIDLPHEFLFTPDAGPVIASLLAHADGWGEAYNFAGPGSITIRDFAKHCFRATGKPPRFRVVGPHLVRFLGLFSPLLRELSEMSLLLTNPVILDDSKLRRLLGAMRKTPYGEGIRSTIEHLRPR